MAGQIIGSGSMSRRALVGAGWQSVPAQGQAADKAAGLPQSQPEPNLGWAAPDEKGGIRAEALQAQQAAEQVQLRLAQAFAETGGQAPALPGVNGPAAAGPAAAQGLEQMLQAARKAGTQGLAEALGAAQEEARTTQEAMLAKLTEKDEQVKTLAEMMKQAKEQAEKIRKQFTLPKNGSRYSLVAVEAYARLSRARSQADVSAAASFARRQLAQCKSALRNDGENSERIRAAVRQLESAITRAGRKKRDLEEERLTEKRRARAEKQRDMKKAHRLKYELRRRQTSRALRENGYINGAIMDGVQQAHLAQQREQQRLAAERAGISPSGISADAAAQRYLTQQYITTPTPALDAGGGAAAAVPAVSLEG